MSVYIVVLGRGLAGRSVDMDSRERIVAGTAEAWRRTYGMENVVLMFAAGTGKDNSPRTMASEYAEWAEMHMIDWPPERKPKVVVNTGEHSVWGTLKEMQWAYRRALREEAAPAMVFVTNPRHSFRAKVMNRFLVKIPNASFVYSRDESPKWYHEALGYLKLFAYLVGAEEFAERFRRKHWAQ